MSVHRNVSASGLDVARRCAGSFALPAVDFGERAEATAGTMRHAVLDNFARAWTLSKDADAARVTVLADTRAAHPDADWLSTMSSLDFGAQLVSRDETATRVLVSEAFAWNWRDRSVRMIEPASHRDYRLDDSWVCGTLDWVLQFPSGRTLVVDFKGPKRVTPARDNLQLAFYALCVARLRGLRTIDVELRHIEEDGSIYADSATLDEWDLDAAEGRISRVVAGVVEAREAVARGVDPQMLLGQHCGYCPCAPVCPAQTRLLREFLDESSRESQPVSGLTAEMAGAAYLRVEAVISIAERLKAALRERAITNGSLPLPDGGSLVPIKVSRQSLLVEQALPVLEEIVGASRAESLVERALDPGSIDRIATEIARERGEKIKDVKAQIWSRLDLRGAVVRRTHTQLRRNVAP